MIIIVIINKYLSWIKDYPDYYDYYDDDYDPGIKCTKLACIIKS